MRHRKFSQRLSRPQGAREALLRNALISLLTYQQVKTTKAKAKFIQPRLEALITLAKSDSLRQRRKAYKILNNRTAVKRLFGQIVPLFKQRTSGFTRILRLSTRHGDGAEMVLLELTDKLPKEKPVQPKKKPAEPKEVKAEHQLKPAPSEKQPLAESKVKEIPQPKREISHPEKEKHKPPKQLKPKKFLGGLRNLFKRERDAL